MFYAIPKLRRLGGGVCACVVGTGANTGDYFQCAVGGQVKGGSPGSDDCLGGAAASKDCKVGVNAGYTSPSSCSDSVGANSTCSSTGIGPAQGEGCGTGNTATVCRTGNNAIVY